MAVLCTFGCGAFGELGTTRADDSKRPDAGVVAFPKSVPRDSAGEPALEAIALGTDHSLAVVGGCVYRWGLLGANTAPRRRNSGPATPRLSPEVVPAPTSISVLMGSNDDGRGRDEESETREGFHPHEGGASNSVRPRLDAVGGPDGSVRAVACGGSNSFMLTSKGEVFLLGSLWPPGGDPGKVHHIWGSVLGGAPSRVAKVAAGWRHCVLLTEAGCLFALGDDEHGQCAGVNNGAVALTLPTTHAVMGIAAGACHSMAWDCAGSVFSWGHGGSGRLGLGSAQHQRTPTKIDKLPEPVCAVGCGANFTVFVSNFGKGVWCCGGNQYGQLGLGVEDRAAREIPTRMGLPRGAEQVVALGCGTNHAICLTRVPGRAGAPENRPVVWAWGCSASGQCGRAEGETRGTPPPGLRAAPKPLADFLEPSPHWAFAVAAGRSHSAVLARVCGAEAAASASVRPWFLLEPSWHDEQGSRNGRGGEQLDDDIIDMFCASLVDSQTPPSKLPNATRSPSPAAELVELGEAVLHGDETSIWSERHIAAGTTDRQLSKDKRARSLTPRRPAAAGGSPWPHPPPSWSTVGNCRRDSRNGAGRCTVQQTRRPTTARRSLRNSVISSSATAGPNRSQSPSVSPVPSRASLMGAGGVSHVSGLSPRTTGVFLSPTPAAPPPVQRDQWTGIYESLQGLSSMIASIGAPSPARNGFPAQTNLHGSVERGDSRPSGEHIAHGCRPTASAVSSGQAAYPTVPISAGFEQPAALEVTAERTVQGAQPPHLHIVGRNAATSNQAILGIESPLRDDVSDAALDFSPRSDSIVSPMAVHVPRRSHGQDMLSVPQSGVLASASGSAFVHRIEESLLDPVSLPPSQSSDAIAQPAVVAQPLVSSRIATSSTLDAQDRSLFELGPAVDTENRNDAPGLSHGCSVQEEIGFPPLAIAAIRPQDGVATAVPPSLPKPLSVVSASPRSTAPRQASAASLREDTEVSSVCSAASPGSVSRVGDVSAAPMAIVAGEVFAERAMACGSAPRGSDSSISVGGGVVTASRAPASATEPSSSSSGSSEAEEQAEEDEVSVSGGVSAGGWGGGRGGAVQLRNTSTVDEEDDPDVDGLLAGISDESGTSTDSEEGVASLLPTSTMTMGAPRESPHQQSVAVRPTAGSKSDETSDEDDDDSNWV